MRSANIFTGTVAALWLALLWLGIGLIEGVAAQHVSGYPNSAQIIHYVGVPLLIVTTLLIFAVFLNRVRRSPTFLAAVSGGALFFIVPYMLGYTGGL